MAAIAYFNKIQKMPPLIGGWKSSSRKYQIMRVSKNSEMFNERILLVYINDFNKS